MRANDEHATRWFDRLVEGTQAFELSLDLARERERLGSWWQVAELVAQALTEVGHRWRQGQLTVTEEHTPFGLSQASTPVVTGRNRNSKRVRPEVSQLSTAVQILAGGLSVPSLTTRRAETTVELASGQSFAIAGLIQDNTRQEHHKIPGLGDLPILGALFQSDRFERSETELVIIVTPYVVRPVNADQLRTPLDPYRAPPLASSEEAPRPQTVPVNPAQATTLGGAQSNTGFILD